MIEPVVLFVDIDANKTLLNQVALIRFMDSTFLLQTPARSVVVLTVESTGGNSVAT